VIILKSRKYFESWRYPVTFFLNEIWQNLIVNFCRNLIHKWFITWLISSLVTSCPLFIFQFILKFDVLTYLILVSTNFQLFNLFGGKLSNVRFWIFSYIIVRLNKLWFRVLNLDKSFLVQCSLLNETFILIWNDWIKISFNHVQFIR
jgi:hypothetical protein